MKAVLKENYEKVLLAFLLVLLSLASVMCIVAVRADKVAVIVGGGEVVDVESLPKLSGSKTSMLIASEVKGLEGFVYCRNSTCKYLIHKDLLKCTWCKTPIVAVEVFDNDTNRNKIDDKLELEWGLKLDDPNEVLRDKDGDGFSTIEEYERDYSPVDSSSHPPLALRSTFVRIENKYIPFKIKDVVISEDIRGNRRVYVDGVHSKRGSFYLSVGERTNWLEIINAGEIDGKKYADLKHVNFSFRMFVGESCQYPDWPKYMINNGVSSEEVAVSIGSKFSLRSKHGSKEEYKLIKFNKVRNELHITNKDLSKEFILTQQELLKEPLE